MFAEEDMGDGDQALACMQFKGQVEHSVPSNFKPHPKNAQAPDASLKLKYAHGFRSFDTRGNLKYSADGKVVFTTAALGVILDPKANTQNFFTLHQDDVVAMAMHPDRDIIATGQMAAKGKAKIIDMFVWKASTGECLAQIAGFHRRAIRNIAFSPDGSKILSIGEDDQHSVAVHDWVNKKMLGSAKVDPAKVFAAEWKNNNEFATVGLKHVKFFTLNGSNLTGKKGTFKSVPSTAICCCHWAFGGEKFLTGTPKGVLLAWSGNSASKEHKAHTDALWSILTTKDGLLTGGNDGKIFLWDKALTKSKCVVDLSQFTGDFPSGVRSMDYSEKTQCILVGTRAAQVLEVSQQTSKAKVLINGHYEGTKQAELWGCAVHPSEQLVASCGADNTVRIWDEHKMIRSSAPFEHDLTAVDWSSNGKFLVVGDRNGCVHSVNAQTLQKMGSEKSSLAGKKNAWVEDLKISPDCKYICYGTHGGLSKLEVVKVGAPDGSKIQNSKAVNMGYSSALSHLDWSSDSTTVLTNTQGYELLWYDVANRSKVNASGTRDMQYATFTSLLGFPVQGIWPSPDYTDVNSVCRSESQEILATAEDSGLVKLFRYPCTTEKASANEYAGHSSHVTKVKFTKSDKFCVTTGGNDKTLLFWETDFCLDDPNSQANAVHDDDSEANNAVVNEDDEYVTSRVDTAKIEKAKAKEAHKAAMKPSKSQVQDEADEDDMFAMEDVGEGDEFMAVRPWIGQMKPPTGFSGKPPKN
jgi:microtubule-associated protein-like 6